MDGDPAVEHQLDSFSLTFPLPYRVAFIVILGMSPWLHIQVRMTNAWLLQSQPSGDGASTSTSCTSAISTCPP